VKDERFEVENGKIQALLRNLGRRIKAEMPAGWGFTLMLFSYGEQGNLFYLSSARREDMIHTLKEFIRKQEVLD